MSDPARNLIGGRYEIIVPLGKGGMGIVYKAYDPVLDRSVAIKKMVSAIVDHDEFRQRFFIEARAIARLNHPNIVTIHELEEHEGDIYIVMEMLEGLPLSTLLKSAIIPLPAQLAILAQACSGLDYAHARGIVHRDIKPANLLLTTTGGVKIVDFGIARLATADVTRSGAMLGTPHYMSPEQINGQDVDYRSDWFSYGACAYELIAGVRPFEASSMAPLLMKISNAAHQPLPEIDPDTPLSLTTVVDRLLSKDREQRPENGAEILRALNAAGDTNRHDVLGEVVRNAMGAAGEMTIVEPLSPARGLTTPLVGAKPTTPIAISLKTPTATPVTPVTPVRVTPAAPAAPATPASASASQQSQGQPPSTEVLWVSGLEGAPPADAPVAAASAPSAGSSRAPEASGAPGASGAAGSSGSAGSVRSPGAPVAGAPSSVPASGLPATIPAGPPGAASASSAPASASASSVAAGAPPALSGGASGSSLAAPTAAAAGDATVPAAGAAAGAQSQTQPVISDIPPARKSLKGALLVVAALFFVLMLAGGGMVWWLLSAARSSSSGSAEAGVLRGVVAQLMTMIGRQPASTTSTSSSASTSTSSQPSQQPDASAASQSPSSSSSQTQPQTQAPAGDASTQPASTTSAQGATGATDASTSASAASSAATQPGTGSTSAAGDQQTSAPVQSRETGSTASVSSGATGSPTSTTSRTGGSNATTGSSNGAASTGTTASNGTASTGTTASTGSTGRATNATNAANTANANANRTTSSTSTRATPVTGTGAHASNGANTSTAGRDVANAHDAAASTGGAGSGTAGDTAGPTTASGSASGDTTSHVNNTHDTRAPLNADTLSAFNRSSGSSSAPSLGYGGDVTNPAASVARIKDTLETYSDAIEKQDLDTLRSVRDPLAAAEAGLAQTANPTSVRFSDVEVHTDGRTAAVRAKRIVSVGDAVKSSAVVDIQLVRRPSGWVITEIH